MTRHHALPISLYATARKIVVIAEDWRADGAPARRAEQFIAAGARVERVPWMAYTTADCDGAFAVLVQHHGAPPKNVTDVAAIAADARDAGALVYIADRPQLSDFAMPGIVARGPLKLAVSSDAVAPALTRRLREQLETLVEAAGPQLDALIAHLDELRTTLPAPERAARLYEDASRVHIRGAIEIDPEG